MAKIIDINEILDTVGRLRQGKLVAFDADKLADWLELLAKNYTVDPEFIIDSIDKFESELINYLKARDVVFSSKDVKSETIELKFSYYREESDKEFEDLITNGIFRLAEYFNIDVEVRLENYCNGFVRDLVVILK